MTVNRRQDSKRLNKMRPGLYRDYEEAKTDWRARNPNASPAEYEAAMRRIALACRV